MTKRLRAAGQLELHWIWAGPGRSSRTTPTPSTWPVTRWPPRRSPSLRALSKFTRSPTFFKGKVVRARVSGDTSKLARGGLERHHRQAGPGHGHRLPQGQFPGGKRGLDREPQALRQGVSPMISPTPSTSPVNMLCFIL